MSRTDYCSEQFDATSERAVGTDVAGGLLSQAKQGDNDAFGTLVERFRESLLKLAEQQISNRLRRRMSYSDVVQETMLSARLQFASFRGQTAEEFHGWLLEIFHSRVVDGIRRHQFAEIRRIDREETPSMSHVCSPAHSPIDCVSQKEDASRLLMAIQRLTPEQQNVIQRRYLDNESFETIACESGMSLTTVWRRFQTATEQIHKDLHDVAAYD